jgi:hypothetical protein
MELRQALQQKAQTTAHDLVVFDQKNTGGRHSHTS